MTSAVLLQTARPHFPALLVPVLLPPPCRWDGIAAGRTDQSAFICIVAVAVGPVSLIKLL